MCKKITLGVLGLALVGGLMFGGRLVPYAKTAINKVQRATQETVPVEFQIEAARDQLGRIGPEIQKMVHQVAKEKVAIDRLAADVQRQETMLEESYDEMMTLREHLESGSEYYVATNSKKYNRNRVEEDLRHRFTMYRTAEETVSKQKEILTIRQRALESALEQLDEAKAQQNELEVQIENLVARNRMNEVLATASKINIDDSQLARTREMIEELDATIAAEAEVLSIAPKYYGQIPVSAQADVDATDILDDIDTYFNQSRGSNEGDDEASLNESF